MDVEWDHEADAVDVALSEELSVYTRVVDDFRLLDYDAAGNLIGLEFLSASSGIRLGGLHLQAHGVDVPELVRKLGEAGVPVLDGLVASTLSPAPTSMNVSALRAPVPEVIVVHAQHRAQITDYSAGLVQA